MKKILLLALLGFAAAGLSSCGSMSEKGRTTVTTDSSTSHAAPVTTAPM